MIGVQGSSVQAEARRNNSANPIAIGIDENEYLDFFHKYERYLLGTPRQCAGEVEKLIDQGFEDIAIYGIESNEELQYFADNFLCQIR